MSKTLAMVFTVLLCATAGYTETPSRNPELEARFQAYEKASRAGTLEPLGLGEWDVMRQNGRENGLGEGLHDHGLAVLPLVIEALRKAPENSFILPYYDIFDSFSQAWLFSTTTNPAKVYVPFGILPLAEAKGLPAWRNDSGITLFFGAFPFEMRDVMLAWWERAPLLLQDRNALEELLLLPLHEDLDELAKRFPKSGWEQLTEEAAKERDRYWTCWWRINWYGIYNIPRFIDVIEQGENGVIFFQLSGILHAFWSEFVGGSNPDRFSDAKELVARFPTREDRIAVICRWWQAKHEDFKTLPDLYAAIDERMRRLCPTCANANPENKDTGEASKEGTAE